MAAALFSAVPHLWSWYLIWVLAPAALVPTWWLSRFVIGAAIMAPFTVVCWWVESLKDYQEPAALAVYVGALLWMRVTRPPSTVSDADAGVPSGPPAAAGAPASSGAER
jgi:hypothetical protein